MRDMFYLQIKKVMRNYTDLNFLMKNLSVNELRSDVKLENKKADFIERSPFKLLKIVKFSFCTKAISSSNFEFV